MVSLRTPTFHHNQLAYNQPDTSREYTWQPSPHPHPQTSSTFHLTNYQDNHRNLPHGGSISRNGNNNNQLRSSHHPPLVASMYNEHVTQNDDGLNDDDFDVTAFDSAYIDRF